MILIRTCVASSMTYVSGNEGIDWKGVMILVLKVPGIYFDNITIILFHTNQNIEGEPRRKEQKRNSDRNYGNNSASEAGTRHKP